MVPRGVDAERDGLASQRRSEGRLDVSVRGRRDEWQARGQQKTLEYALELSVCPCDEVSRDFGRRGEAGDLPVICGRESPGVR